jgi:hypothetical protein
VRPVKLAGLLFLLPVLACVNVNLSSAPQQKLIIPPTSSTLPSATPVVWPTLSPRATPIEVRVRSEVPLPAASPLPECLQPDLPVKQHTTPLGDTSTREKFVVGPMLCQIQRDSCAYNLLVGKPDPSIIFKREESAPFDMEDMLIHPAVVQPLTRLRQLVHAEWDGEVQLRVTDAYDSLLSHDPPESEPEYRYSLHYEGRAIDLTTWPVDRSRYDRLCALALCAGFDWVHNEGTHCHASVKATSLCTLC